MADRTVRVVLDLDLGPAGNRAMQKVAESGKVASGVIEQAWQRVEKRVEAVRSGEYRANAAAARYVEQIESKERQRIAADDRRARYGSVGGALVGAMPKALMGLGIAGAVGHTVAGIAGPLHDPYSSGTGTARDIFKGVVPFGSSILGGVDSITGRTASMQQADLYGQRAMATAQSVIEGRGAALSLNPEQAGRVGFSGAYGRQSAITGYGGERSSASGERAFREESRMLPVREAAAKAERDSAAAAMKRVEFSRQLQIAERSSNELLTRRAAIEKRLEDSGPKRKQQLLEIAAIDAEYQGTLNIQKQARQGVSQSAAEQAQAQADKKRAAAAGLGAQADTLEERAATAAGSARKLGTMNRIEQGQALNAVKLVKQFGAENLPPEIVNQAMSIGGEDIGKEIEKRGAASPLFGEFQKELPTSFAGRPEDLRQQAGAARKQQAELAFEADKEAAQATTAAFSALGKYIAEVINKSADITRKSLEDNLRLQKTS